MNLHKLEWQILASRLSGHAQTDDGQARCLSIEPNLTRDLVSQRWQTVTPLRDIVRSGYKTPIGSLKTPHHIFKAADKGQLLEGADFRILHELLTSVKKVISFAGSFAAKAPAFQQARSRLDALPKLLTAIDDAIAPDGSVLDTATPELADIRARKTALRRRIEEVITRVMHEHDVLEYLQDDFYTYRHDKYVLPLRLDGRGRVKGTIVDTSDSGQTLYIEPFEVAGMNRDLQDLDVAEKLEIIKIIRDLSARVAGDLFALRQNYSELIHLDVLTAEAALAVEIDAGSVHLSDTPCLNLIEARHPLIKTPSGKTAEPNTIALKSASGDLPQTILIVSGPNAGGKTVVLKTTGLLHLMAKAGLLIPADPKSSMFLFDHIYLELGDGQNITQNLSTFSGHLHGLKPILERSGTNDLVLLDELATGTEPRVGAAIARAILEDLADKKVTTIATTHYDNLKGLAINDHRYRNASMEYAEASYRPTYRLILDVPGQSYGLELATQIGLPQSILKRASVLKGEQHSAFDDAIAALQKARIESEDLKRRLDQELLAAENSRARWDEECRLLDEQRSRAARNVAAKLETQVETLRSEFEDKAKELKTVVKAIRSGNVDPNEAYEKKRGAESALRQIESTVQKISETGLSQDLPGTPVDASDLREGLNVYVLPLRKEGVITKIGANQNEAIEVQVGIIKVRVGILDLRKTRGSSGSKPIQSSSARTAPQRVQASVKSDKPELPEFVPQNAANTLDLRGADTDSAVNQTLNFIDRCLMSGEKFAVIIHGNGNDRLKTSIRSMLRSNCPYNVAFRSGDQKEGGDGVTVIAVD